MGEGQARTCSVAGGDEAVFRTETDPGHVVLDGGRFRFD